VYIQRKEPYNNKEKRKFELVQGYDGYSTVNVTLINQYLIEIEINTFNYTISQVRER
jgi:hypothetical protein